MASTEDDALRVKVSERATGSSQVVKFPLALFTSQGYRSLRSSHERLTEAVGKPPFVARLGKRTESVATFEQLRPTHPRPGQGGPQPAAFQGVRRDEPIAAVGDDHEPREPRSPAVSIEDAAAADEMFSMLMGDRVEPRREFIERNAGDVKYLDI